MSGVNRVAKSGARPPVPKVEAGDLNHASLDLGRRTYLTVRQVAEYLPLPSDAAVYMWAHRNKVPKCYVGRRVRFLRSDVDDAVQKRREVLHGGVKG